MYDAITDVPGIKVGHYTNRKAATGCTVVLCEDGAVGGVDVRGASPGTRDTDLLRPMNQVERIHAILLSGGSCFGLDAAGGVQRYLEERGYGYEVANVRVPIVPAAILFDLAIGNAKVRPGIKEGYKACVAAKRSRVPEGCVGAGTGAMVGQLMGTNRSTKSGLGTASEKICGNVIVGAIIAVNALGDIIDPNTGDIIAGLRRKDGKGFIRSADLMKKGYRYLSQPGSNTVIGVVATNARLTKEQANKVAQMAHDGMARAINPCHTMLDGDTIFALSTGTQECDITTVGLTAADMICKAIIRGVTQATALANVPSLHDVVTK
ncbi:MAG: peptidase S58 family protein [Dehalococcoidia bacterium]|nr:MAG: peptidase S58 family protein [Dehalococcoidia bacterium]